MAGRERIRRELARLGLAAATITALSLASAPSAGATATCTLDEFLQPFVNVTGRDAVALRMSGTTLTYDPGADGGYISCGVTTDDMRAITVTGEAGTPQGLVLEGVTGTFGHGVVLEGEGRNETEIFVNLKGGSHNIPDALWVTGTSATDQWSFGKIYRRADETPTTGVNLNFREGDFDADVIFPDQIPGVVKFFGRGGLDVIEAGTDPDARGFLIKPIPVAYLLQIDGNDGDDRLEGSNRDNTRAACVRQNPFPFRFISFDRVVRDECLTGGRGDDVFFGSIGAELTIGDPGDDLWRVPIVGGPGPLMDPGDDRMLGNEGADEIEGGNGDDDLDGGAGRDEMRGQNGADHLNGGDGSDECRGGPGRDRLRNCER